MTNHEQTPNPTLDLWQRAAISAGVPLAEFERVREEYWKPGPLGTMRFSGHDELLTFQMDIQALIGLENQKMRMAMMEMAKESARLSLKTMVLTRWLLAGLVIQVIGLVGPWAWSTISRIF